MNPIVKRTLTALAAAAAVTALFLWCPLAAIFPIVLAFSTLVQLEFYQMARAYEPQTVWGLLFGAAYLVFVAALPVGCAPAVAWILQPLFFTGVVFVLALGVLFSPRRAHPIASGAVTAAGFFYVPFLLSFFLRYVQLGAPGDFFAVPAQRTGLYTLLAVLAVTKLSDMGGFAFGLAFGRHRMCPAVSPKKSWEGFAGSVVGSCLMASLFTYLARRNGWAADVPAWGAVTYPLALAFGFGTAACGTLGDLIESRFKRECGMKDSATFMPAGMGGFLDMFDSILFLPALAYPLFAWGLTAAH